MTQPLHTIDPHTGRELDRYPATSTAELDAMLSACAPAWERWARAPIATRAHVLRRAAALLRERKALLADHMTAQMGKLTAEAQAEVDKCAWVCEHYADHGPAYLADQPVQTEARASHVVFRPLGTILAVMPWNFPLWQVFRFVAPALVAGNACLLKHASNVPGCALDIAGLLRDAGLPPGVFQAPLVSSSAVPRIIAHPAIRAVTLTGSTPAGRAVAAEAGAQLKKTVLELGGSDPYLILEDADLDHAARACVRARFMNAGQSCIAAKRWIVLHEIADAFADRVQAQISALRCGDPRDPATTLAPMARADLRDELHLQVRRSVDAGARLVLGGACPEGPGAHYPATLLDHVTPGMPAHDEELFGPVAVIERAKDLEHALELANATTFGLGAAVFTGDVGRGERIAREGLRAGCAFVNDAVRSDPRLPFGGVGDSGHGRELGAFGIHEFVNVKTIWVA